MKFVYILEDIIGHKPRGSKCDVSVSDYRVKNALLSSQITLMNYLIDVICIIGFAILPENTEKVSRIHAKHLKNDKREVIRVRLDNFCNFNYYNLVGKMRL